MCRDLIQEASSASNQAYWEAPDTIDIINPSYFVNMHSNPVPLMCRDPI